MARYYVEFSYTVDLPYGGKKRLMEDMEIVAASDTQAGIRLRHLVIEQGGMDVDVEHIEILDENES